MNTPLNWRKASARPSGSACVEIAWRKASACTISAACVEIGALDGEILMRDSKLADSPILRFGTAGWAAFVEGVRRGEYDRA